MKNETKTPGARNSAIPALTPEQMKKINLITESNNKIQKGVKLGFHSMGIHLAPSTLSGFNTCAGASVGCASACLNSAGMGKFSNVQQSRINKTKFFFKDKEKFMLTLADQLTRKIKSAERKNLKPCFRPNLTSDLPFEKIKIKGLKGKTLMELFPALQFYDYTKIPARMSAYLAGDLPANYCLTFSRNESKKNQKLCESFLKAGGNCAYVFKDKLPATYRGHKVISGMEHDLRFKDPQGQGLIIGLLAIGDAKKDKSGFVIKDHLK